MPKYRRLEVFTESDSDDDDDWNDDDLVMAFPRRKRRSLCPCWRTKKRRLVCIVLSSVAFLLVLVGVGIGVGVYLSQKGNISPSTGGGPHVEGGSTSVNVSSTMTFTTSLPPSPGGISSMMPPATPSPAPTSGTKSINETSVGPTTSTRTMSANGTASMNHTSIVPSTTTTHQPAMNTSTAGHTNTSSPTSTAHSMSTNITATENITSVAPTTTGTHPMGVNTTALVNSTSMMPTAMHFQPSLSSSVQWWSTSYSSSLSQNSYGTVMILSSHIAPSSPASEQGSTVMTGPSAPEPTPTVFPTRYLPSQTSFSSLWTRSAKDLQTTSGSYHTYGGGSTTVEQSPTPKPSPLPKRCGSVDEVCKPLTDQSEYRVITLNNSLRVLLVSNNETSTSAAAVDVYSGSFNDGHIEGLAHFCEHMLFLGTEKYPDEGSYSKYLSTNGGYDNAYTSSENTNYYLSVNSDKLEGALDRLAQFFVSPLFNESGVDREKNAVNSEYQKDRGIPGWIDYLMMKTVAVPASPFSK